MPPSLLALSDYWGFQLEARIADDNLASYLQFEMRETQLNWEQQNNFIETTHLGTVFYK